MENHPVIDYILKLPENQKDIALLLHDLLVSTYGLSAKLSYKVPFYYGLKWLCYIIPKKEGGLELCFTRGWELNNQSGLLKANKRKQIQGVYIESIENMPLETLQKIIEGAIYLDKKVKYKTWKSRTDLGKIK